jgi:hypothetical protein
MPCLRCRILLRLATGLDGLMHGSLTHLAGFIVARATRDSLHASPPAGAAPHRTGCMMQPRPMARRTRGHVDSS